MESRAVAAGHRATCSARSRNGAKLDLVLPTGKTVGEVAMAAAVKAHDPQLISVLHDARVAVSIPAPASSEKAQTKSLVIHVQDSSGKPIEGATIKPHILTSFPSNHTIYRWLAQPENPWPRTTDAQGNAEISYPVYTVPDLKTSSLHLAVEHPGFSYGIPRYYQAFSKLRWQPHLPIDQILRP